MKCFLRRLKKCIARKSGREGRLAWRKQHPGKVGWQRCWLILWKTDACHCFSFVPVFKPLPDPADYTEDWLKSGAGLPDPHSGILPSLVTVDITDFLCGKGNKQELLSY